jgi:hypothetical protein
MIPDKAVTLLEILRCYAENYVRGAQALSVMSSLIEDKPIDAKVVNRLHGHLVNFLEHCCKELPMTEQSARSLAKICERGSAAIDVWEQPKVTLQCSIADIQNRLTDELSLNFFFKLSQDRKDYFDDPFKGWADIVTRFDLTLRDVEEMNKCFALCRYTAAMYHAMQIAEAGAIELGIYIGVADPKKGWGPTEKLLQQIVKDGHSKLPPHLAGKFEFLEQMSREIDSMVLAWRHKVDHAANHLAIIPNAEFTPDIAEHVMSAVRVFMLRLLEGIP